MDSRPILKDAAKIGVFIDSATLEPLLNQNVRIVNAILRHYDSDHLEFVRSPLQTENEALKKIPEYKLVMEDSEIKAIKINGKTQAFSFKMGDITSISSEIIFKKKELAKEEIERVVKVFVQAKFNIFTKSNIFITEDAHILKNRRWFESNFPGYPLNIMTSQEASLFLDFFFKKGENYYADSRYRLNKGYWYWLSMRLRLPHYNVGDPMMDALAFRMYYSLMALDEIGIQYYLGSDNDTMDNTLYHFNYLITLITGIFDNLALKTNSRLGINFTDLRKVSLSNNSGRDFLAEIRSKDTALRSHINDFMNFIMLIYSFREKVIHREGLGKSGFEYRGQDGRWQSNFIKISEEIKNYLKQCGDTASKYDPFTNWGFYEAASELYVEPFNFSMNVLETLTKFVDKYLELLSYPSFINEQRDQGDDFAKTLLTFEKFHLGF